MCTEEEGGLCLASSLPPQTGGNLSSSVKLRQEKTAAREDTSFESAERQGLPITLHSVALQRGVQFRSYFNQLTSGEECTSIPPALSSFDSFI